MVLLNEGFFVQYLPETKVNDKNALVVLQDFQENKKEWRSSPKVTLFWEAFISTCLLLCANFKVLWVSSLWPEAGVTLQISYKIVKTDVKQIRQENINFSGEKSTRWNFIVTHWNSSMATERRLQQTGELWITVRNMSCFSIGKLRDYLSHELMVNLLTAFRKQKLSNKTNFYL